MDGDPEDWPADPQHLRQLDRSLRCQICGDIYTGPVALACGHSFCSRCIRDSFNVRIKEGQTPDAAGADAVVDAAADAAAVPGTSSEDDFELQQQPAKRPRSSQHQGRQQDVQQQSDAAPKQQQQQPSKQAQLPPGYVACPICSLASSNGSTSSSRGRRGAALEAPPKLCFELLKERDLKAKLSGLGLSNEGSKKNCVDRYTAFRNYVLALKDSGATDVSLAAAAADFTKQQKRYARAAARGGGLGTITAAAAAPGAGSAGSAGRPVSVWVLLTLVAAAALLAGYTLGVAQQMVSHDSHTIIARLKIFRSAGSNYTVLSRAAWSRSPWAQPCSAGLPRRVAAGSEAGSRRQLCELPTIWRNCSQGIYLDVGTNLGVQLRKLYNPEQFPGAPVLPIFDKAFSKQRSGVCALGVEANPHHTPYLNTVNGFFQQRGYQALILTEVAASIRNGTASFFLDSGSPVEWGASLTKGGWQKNNGSSGAKVEAHVQLLNLPAFAAGIVRPILQQELAATGRLPPVVMKLDVEGEEYALFPALLLSGGLCDISVLFLEVHGESFRNADGVNMTMPHMQQAFATMRKANPPCRVQVQDLDDETFLNSKAIPFPSVAV
ncbi:hypothetical protein OEZ86_002913 [Tetradesmus obliquus]|nr:hypothetical protein OEZ86_002913 [Tetradesmus obliquus]